MGEGKQVMSLIYELGGRNNGVRSISTPQLFCTQNRTSEILQVLLATSKHKNP